MEWLKDKKNLPIVIAIAVFVILVAAGISAYTLGAFSGNSQASAPATPAPAPVGIPPSGPPAGFVPPSGPPAPSRDGADLRSPAAPAAAVAAVPKKSTVLNPAVGPDPFFIPGGKQRLAKVQASTGMGVKLPIRDLIAPLNLFSLRPPTPPAPPDIPGVNAQTGVDPAANYRLAGVVTGSDGINAILEVGGNSQSVKPGDSLSDGSKVQNIQTTSITLKTASGTIISLPLSAGTPEQGTNNPYGPSQFQPGFGGGRLPFNGPPSFNGQPPFSQQGKDN